MAPRLTRRRASIVRRLGRAFAGSALLAAVISGYVWLVARTTRWTMTGREGWEALVAAPGGFLCLTWHGRLFMGPTYAPGSKRAVAMISRSRDGDLIAAVIGRWGVDAVRGSSHDHAKRRSRGAVTAFAGALAALNDGALVAITPDGPRGPRMHAHAGAAELAAAARVPAIAVAFSVRWGWHLRSWDRFLMPLPFGRGAIVYGAPRLPPAERCDKAMAGFLRALEADLNTVTYQADRLCGRVHGSQGTAAA